MIKILDRRTLLKGVGATVALPLLEAMIPPTMAQGANEAQLRSSFVYVPHGVILDDWIPSETGTDFKYSPILKSLEPFRDQVQIFSNLKLNTNNTAGSGHATSSTTWLSGAVAKDTSGSDVEAGTTLDQLISEHVRGDTPLPSMEMAIEDAGQMVGACDGTSSCSYINTISWKSPTIPNPMEINPRTVFERMFGVGETTQMRLSRTQLDKSLLDSIGAAAENMNKGLGAVDQRRMSTFLENIREVEVRISNLEKRMMEGGANLSTAPTEIPELYEEHVRAMFELQVLAFQTDTSRVSSFMLSRELNQRTYPQIGVPEQHHGVSHHGYNPERQGMHSLINQYHVKLFAEYFVGRLASIEDIDGSLLDNSMILYGAGMGDGNVHSKNPVSALVIGGGAGKLRSGRHVDMITESGQSTPIANLLLGMSDVVGLNLDSIGDSTGRIKV
tara:strand:- start:3544 stop:4875 length:1332 start_codon:yes stop_codon:yes gene_type:complete